MPESDLTAVDAFCGPGGLSLGLTRAGFRVVAAFDNDPPSIQTYARNLSHPVFEADAAELTGVELLRRAGLESGEPGLLAGGPPCQGFSKQKRGAHLGDPRNALVLEFLRLVREVRPRSFLLENVAQLAQVRGLEFVDRFSELADYALHGRFYVAADFGVAQTRERFMLVGLRRDASTSFVPPKPTTPGGERPTIRDAIGDLPEPPSDYSVHPRYPNHQAARVTQRNIERFSHVPPGGGWQDIPWDLRLRCHQVVDTSKGGWPDVYGRLTWDGQCPTITGGFDSFTRGRYGHPEKDRPLTPREAARLQGFPDSFEFIGTRHDVRHQIGNAVPCPLSTAVGRQIVAALRSETPPHEETEELALF